MRKISGIAPEGYLEKARREITAWESGKRSYLARLGDFALDPAANLTAKMVPQSVQRAASQMIEKTLRLAAHSGKFSVDTQAITKERVKGLGRKKALGPRLGTCDALAKKFWTSHCGYAAAEGAATGVIGLAGFVADIPLILSIAIREIRTIALCYGYSANDPGETDYALHVLRIAACSKDEVRAKILQAIKEIEQTLAQTAIPKNIQGTRKEKVARVKYLVTIEEYAKSLAIELMQRRALQLVPIVGVVTGASFNAAYANDIGRAAYMCYRRRFIGQSTNFPGK